MKKVKQAKIVNQYFDENLNCYVSVCASERAVSKRSSKYVTMKERADKLRVLAPVDMNNYDLAVNFGFIEKEAVQDFDDLLFRSLDIKRAGKHDSRLYSKSQTRHANRN